MKKAILIALVSAAAIGAQAALITNEGASDPTSTIAENLSTIDVGNREISWRSATIHSEIGQSFVAVSDGVAQGISLLATSPENYATAYASPVTFKLKVFSGNVGATAVELGSFSYDATTLADGTDDVWLRFGLDSGVPMTSGNTYSFILTFASLDADHRVNFQRTKGTTVDGDQYLSGAELRPVSDANLYDAANFDTDPWDLDGNPVGELGTGDLRFAVDTIPEPATFGLLALFGGALIWARKTFVI